MNSGTFKWLFALSISLLIHSGLASFFSEGPEEILIEGGASVQVATFGTAFADSIASGDAKETLEPVEPDTQTVEPTQEPSELLPVDLIETIKPQLSEPLVVAETPPLEISSEPAKSFASNANTISPLQQPIEQETFKSIETAALAPDVTETSEPSSSLEPILPELETVPIPTKRDVFQPKPKKQKPKEIVKEKPKKNNQKKKAKSGDKGKSKVTQKSGANNGSKKSKNKQQGKKNRLASIAGNAAASNYPGKIVRKLRRSLRYPTAAKRKKIRGQVMVSFVVSQSGQVSRVRVLTGSGSPILDEAAIKTVYRAAPFPKIPESAGRSRWSFRVPLAFK